jgi:hypothetical protein
MTNTTLAKFLEDIMINCSQTRRRKKDAMWDGGNEEISYYNANRISSL